MSATDELYRSLTEPWQHCRDRQSRCGTFLRLFYGFHPCYCIERRHGSSKRERYMMSETAEENRGCSSDIPWVVLYSTVVLLLMLAWGGTKGAASPERTCGALRRFYALFNVLG